jgi:hypothetical protein
MINIFTPEQGVEVVVDDYGSTLLVNVDGKCEQRLIYDY